MPLHTERDTSVWRTLRDKTGLSPCEIRPTTYMTGQRGHMIDRDVCLVVQDVHDIIRYRQRQDSICGLVKLVRYKGGL